MPGSKPGERRGGRKKGTANKRSRAIADKAAAEGITPLELLLREMRWCMREVDQLRAKKSLSEGDRTHMVNLVREMRQLAHDAAPYMHPRLQSTTLQGTGTDGAIKTEEVLTDTSQLARRLLLLLRKDEATRVRRRET